MNCYFTHTQTSEIVEENDCDFFYSSDAAHATKRSHEDHSLIRLIAFIVDIFPNVSFTFFLHVTLSRIYKLVFLHAKFKSLNGHILMNHFLFLTI